jgi:Arc/MetJ family transcription regulator
MEVESFGAPIPGQSLFTTPNERPYERPSELDTVDDALSYYFTNLRDPEIIDDLMTVVDMGIPLEPIVKTLYMSSVMNGIHNLDVGLIVAPVLSEFLAAVAKSYEIDFKYTAVDAAEQKSEKENMKVQMMLRAAIDRGIETSGEEDRGVALLKEMAESLEEQGDMEVKVKEDVTDAPPPPAELQMVKEQGLMSRRGM